jgi:transcriptional regulator with XRE-family HTH domain
MPRPRPSYPTRVRSRPGGLIAEMRRIRIERGILQYDLSAIIGVERDQVSNWECGRTQPLFGNLQAWANALGYRLGLYAQPSAAE